MKSDMMKGLEVFVWCRMAMLAGSVRKLLSNEKRLTGST
jgi:hypothetical protein